MIRRRFVVPAIIATFALAALSLGSVSASAAGVSANAEAAGSPGLTSHQGQSRKDCVGTSRTTDSKIWFTVARGILSDVYAPTLDATNVETMQYLVTDGSSFTDLQSRDTTYTVSSDTTGTVCTITSTAKSGAYRLVNTYFTDPSRNSVVVRTKFQPLTKAARNYSLYVRLDANAGGNGGGGPANGGADTAVIDTSTAQPVPVSFDTNTTSQANRTAYAVPSYLALTGDRPFTSVSSGFVGTASDGLTQLDSTHTLGPLTTTATGGNVEQTVGVQRDRNGESVLALGFGTSQATAVATASATASSSQPRLQAGYRAGWARYDAGLKVPVLTAPGLSDPQRLAAIKNYYQSANVVKASEDKTYPGAIVAGLDAPWGQSVVANDPNNLFVGGYKEVFARDLYEAWTALYTDGDISTAQATVRYLLLKSQQANGSQPRNSLLDGTKAADAFNDQLDETAYPILMALQSGLAGDTVLWPHVKSAANFLVSHGPSFGVERWEEQTGYSPSTIAAEIAGLIAAATIADQHHDPASARVWRATADQYQSTIKAWGVTTNGPLSSSPYFIRLSKTGDPNLPLSYNVGNGGPTLDQRAVADAGFLECVRLGILRATDPVILNSLVVTDATIQRPTDSGPGWLRYNGGILSARVDQPHELRSGSRPRAGVGLGGCDRLAVRQRPGHGIHRLRERPGGWIGLTVDLGIGLADVATDANSVTTLTHLIAGADGSFTADVTSAAGTNVFVITSTAPNGGTAQVVRSVVNGVVSGTQLYSIDNPIGDDHGPGNSTYPKAGDFHAGAFDLDRFQVYDTGSTVTFRVQTADLTPTFVQTNGAQLVDVYVSQPGALPTSRASSHPGTNYSTNTLWSRLIEVQGFGNNRFVDASDSSLGAVTVGANAVSRYITFSVGKTALGGTPASGWGFTVAITGQDGYSSEQSRGFTPTAGDYSFGMCAVALSTLLCSKDPNAVPKVMDTIVPTGVMQATELDYTAGAVRLAAVVVP